MAIIGASALQNLQKTTQKSSTPSSSKKSNKIVTTKGTVLSEATVKAAVNKRDLGKIEIIPFDKPDISKFPTTIPPRVSAIPSPINIPTLAKGNFSSFLQYAANKSISVGKDCEITVQKGITKADAVSQIDLCNLVSYFLTQALPSGSNQLTQFNTLKKNAQDILNKIQETEEQVLHFPIKQNSIASPAGIPNTSGSSNTSTPGNPQPTNISNTNSNYGGSGTFFTPSKTQLGVSSTSGNNGTSAGNGLTVDQSLQSIRKVKDLVNNLHIPESVLKILPGGAKLVESLKRINQNVPDNISNFPQQDIRKIFQTFSDLKDILNGIANAENPADLLKVISANNAISKIQDILNPKNLIPTLNSILVTVTSLNKTLSTLNSYISKLASIANSLNTIVQVFKTLAKYIRKLPIPNMWTTAGLTSTLSNIAEVIDKKADQAASNIEQTTSFLNALTRALSGVIARVNVLIELLTYILGNLQKCDKTKNLPITQKLKEATLLLQNNFTQLQTLLPKKPTTSKTITYKGYNLTIVEEEVTDTGIALNRRYGIVTDKRGVLILKSELTYSTNTDLIYNELKFLIDKNGLNANVSNTTSTTSEADAINAQLDIPTNAEQNAELAQTQSDINEALNQVQPIKNMQQKQTKRDKRRLKRLKRIIKRLKANGLTKSEIRNWKGVRNYTTQEFENAWNELNQN
jgi:hypothetical protein